MPYPEEDGRYCECEKLQMNSMNLMGERLENYGAAVMRYRWALVGLGLLLLVVLLIFNLLNWKFFAAGLFFAACGWMSVIWRTLSMSALYFFWVGSVILVLYTLLGYGGSIGKLDSIGSMLAGAFLLYGIFGVACAFSGPRRSNN